jgi:hypothetical protein
MELTGRRHTAPSIDNCKLTIGNEKRSRSYALTTLPLRRQAAQTRIRLFALPTLACTGRRLTFQRRFVTLCAWLMLFPNCGFLPHIAHT